MDCFVAAAPRNDGYADGSGSTNIQVLNLKCMTSPSATT